MKRKQSSLGRIFSRAIALGMLLLVLGVALVSGWVWCLCEHDGECGAHEAGETFVEGGCADVQLTLGVAEEVRVGVAMPAGERCGAARAPWKAEAPLGGCEMVGRGWTLRGPPVRRLAGSYLGFARRALLRS